MLVGELRHAHGVRRLQRSYACVPPGSPVRLAKRTSNLFRARTPAAGAGLDTTGLTGVISVDAAGATADVQGMCTYHDLVAATLEHAMVPLVVPQLRTITLGGAVSGLGIESSSFRAGLVHESVLEMDVLTGDGRVVRCSPEVEPDLFAAFPNSYGSLGYAVRLRIELAPALPLVALRHVRFHDLDALVAAIETLCRNGSHDDERVDFLDGVVFAQDEAYLTLGRWSPTAGDAGGTASDYTGQRIYYRSLRERERDVLTAWDYLWRWDTDWFWCSRAFGAQHPLVRRVWPARWRRSDVYHRLVGLEHRFGVAARVERLRRRPARERVVQDVEVPAPGAADFLRWFSREVGMSPVWLCPLRLREPDGPGSARSWPLYPLQADRTYLNVGFWGTVPIAAGAADGDVNRAVEQAVRDQDGHKSLYSDSYYPPDVFDATYGGEHYRRARARYDPAGRLTGMHEKAVGRR